MTQIVQKYTLIDFVNKKAQAVNQLDKKLVKSKRKQSCNLKIDLLLAVNAHKSVIFKWLFDLLVFHWKQFQN